MADTCRDCSCAAWVPEDNPHEVIPHCHCVETRQEKYRRLYYAIYYTADVEWLRNMPDAVVRAYAEIQGQDSHAI